MSLSDMWYDFYDVEVTYTNGFGVDTTETINIDTNVSYEISHKMVPDKFNFVVVATPKAEQPEVVADSVYTNARNISVTIWPENTETEAKTILGIQSSNSSRGIKGERLSFPIRKPNKQDSATFKHTTTYCAAEFNHRRTPGNNADTTRQMGHC